MKLFRYALPQVALGYLAMGLVLTFLWRGLHLDIGSAVMVVAWPVFAILRFIWGVASLLVTLVAAAAAVVFLAVAYWEISQRRMERRMGLRRKNGQPVYVGRGAR